jgi:hypothetical protein
MPIALNLSSRICTDVDEYKQSTRPCQPLLSKSVDGREKSLVDRFLAATSRFSLREVEALSGVSYATVAKFRNGTWKRLYPSTVRQIEDFLAKGEEIAAEEERPEDVGYSGEGADQLALVLQEMDKVARFMTRMGPPGAGILAKRAYLAGIRDIIVAAGMPLPQFWYELSEKVESGAL